MTPDHPRRNRWRPLACLLTVAAAGPVASCQPAERPPNVLWIVWDTVRADRMSLYGHERQTTPFLDGWARDARVYRDVLSTASYTVPSHASMFTGLLPSEHCTHNGNKQLDDGYVTIAELLQQVGYRTYLYSANPHISSGGNFTQGFELAEHPWSPRFRERALEIVQAKLEGDRSNELPERLETHGMTGLTAWNIKAAGELAEDATLDWLEGVGDRPWFAFLNYMEAHRPLIPQRRFREALLDAASVEASYGVDRTWDAMWAYTFGLRDYDERELELTRATYDAAVLELDTLLASLITRLDEAGHLDNTIVVLTSDHGEHLGEQHMFDHQYTVYQPALRVPLVLRFPPRVEAGSDDRPAMHFDLFPTLLELTGVAPPEGLVSRARSLLEPAAERPRFAEEPSFSTVGVSIVKRTYPEFDPTPWQRQLRTLVEGDDKFIWASDGRHDLFDLARDPWETHDLLDERPELAERLELALRAYYESLSHCLAQEQQYEQMTPEQRELLKSLGYIQ